MKPPDTHGSEDWPRVIALVDMNAFFASIEQAENPALLGKPIAITNGEIGTCIITSSYEARTYGISACALRMRNGFARI